MMFAGMNQQKQDFLTNLQNSEATMRAELQQMKQTMDQMTAGAMAGGATGKGGDWHQGQGAWEQGGKGGNGRVVLDGKYDQMEFRQTNI